jgi:peptidoglycan L-alanyl-D-glutamate endopeptidase CwlK
VKSSRAIDDLQPHVAAKCRAHLAACEAAGIDVLVTCTLRDWEMQAQLYRQGRTAPGAVVTNAQAGDSAHNYGLAYDVVPIRNGKPVWGTIASLDAELWERVGELGEEAGMEWAGRWRKFREFAHFQDLGGLTVAELKSKHQQGATALA